MKERPPENEFLTLAEDNGKLSPDMEEKAVNTGFVMFMLVAGVFLIPFGIGFLIIAYAIGYWFYSLFKSK